MNRKPIFIGGCPRSGTTLLRAMLDSHPSIVCGPELRVLPSLASLSADMRRVMGGALKQHYHLSAEDLDAIFARLIASFLEPLLVASGKARVAEKTPANALHFAELARLFPDAQFVQIIRDGRDVVASLLGMGWKDKHGAPLAITRDPRSAARAWTAHVLAGRLAPPARYFEIRYERLIADPAAELRALFRFLGEAWSDDVLAYSRRDRSGEGENETSAGRIAQEPDMTSIGRWRRDLSAEAVRVLREESGALLAELGYADHDW